MANLLDEASILLTPTAYNNGSMLAIKPENGDGDFTFSRNSAATRVNAQGLVENVQILSSNLVSNGDFSQEGSQLITNGDFATDSDWTLGTGWSIGDGKALYNGVSEPYLYNLNPVNIAVGDNLKITFVLDSNAKLRFVNENGSRFSGTWVSYASGTHEVYLTSSIVATQIGIQADTDNGAFGITNISVKEVGQNWTLGTGWSIGENKAVSDGTQISQSNLYQSGVVPINKTYKVTFSTVVTSGSLVLAIGGSNPQPTVTTSGTYTYTSKTTIGDSNLYFSASSDFIGSITNISVKEITDDTNLPRINYEGFSYDANGDIIPNSGCGSWLMEGQSTNLITQSEDFSDAYWTKNGASVVSGFVSPDGTANAFKLVEDTSTGAHLISRSLFGSGVNLAKYTLSVFAKKGERDLLVIQDGTTVNNAFFDLTNGVVDGITGAGTAKIESLGNHFYRCSFTFTQSGVDLRPQFALADITLSGSPPSYTGDGTSGVYIYGAQVEQNSFSTSLIPTSGASSTRLADIANNSGNASLINSEEGTLYFEGEALADDGTDRKISISDGTLDNDVVIGFSRFSGNINAEVHSGGNLQTAGFGATGVTQDNNNKFALSWGGGVVKFYVNGIQTNIDTGATPPIGLNQLRFSLGNAAQSMFSKTKSVQVYKTALTDANLRSLTYPSAVATTFDLNFNTIANDFTFTRGSEATFVNAQGLIQSTASNDAPRLDYSTGAEAFLLEPQSTNLITQSELFSDSYWTKIGASVVGGFTSPSGGLNAFKLVEDTSNAIHIIFRGGNTFASGQDYSYSFYAKRNGRSQILVKAGSTSTFGVNAIFDLQNGTSVSTVGTSNIQLISNEWYKCSVSGLASSTVPTELITYLYNGAQSYQGDGTSGIYIYGTQLEQNSFSTSYIPTSGASATRNQELCNNATPVINSEEGTLYFEGSVLEEGSLSRYITISDGVVNNNAIRLLYNNSNALFFQKYVNGVRTTNISTTSITKTDFNKIAIRYNSTEISVFVNGVNILNNADTNVMLPNTLNVLGFAAGEGYNKFFGNTKGLKYYPKALADVQLQDLTTI